MSTVLTTRITSTANASVLARLAERWRPSGLHLAFFAASGELIWHDTHSPRLLSLCAIDLRILTHFITNLHDKLPASHLPILTPPPVSKPISPPSPIAAASWVGWSSSHVPGLYSLPRISNAPPIAPALICQRSSWPPVAFRSFPPSTSPRS